MITAIILVTLLFIGFYKLIALSSLKITAFAVDFLLIFIYTTTFMHGVLSVKISSGYVVYFWDIVFGILAMGIYGFLILLIHRVVPIVSKGLNYFITFLGVFVAIRLATSFATSFINIFNSNFKPTDHIQLLNNVTVDKVVYIFLAILIAIPVWNVRMEKLNS